MNAVAQALSGLRVGDLKTHEGLAVHPLIRDSGMDKDYLTLDEALARHQARVVEVSAGGSVPNLLFSNHGAQAVFLLDGEELVGAKQNRILNITVLAPANKDTVIPVSCVESGRWQHTRDDFYSAPRAQFSMSRAKKAARVSENLAAFSEACSDQGEVWSDISDKMGSMHSHSPTSAVEQVYQDHEQRLAQFVAQLNCVEGQVGAVFSIKGRVTGLEFFDAARTCQLLMPKIIRSYALDAIDPAYRGYQASGLGSVAEIIARLTDSSYAIHQAVGEGEDLRFDSTPGIAGGALFARGRVVHLCAFVSGEHQAVGDGSSYSASASQRRRYRNVA